MKSLLTSLLVILFLSACSDNTYTLYRTQVRNENARTHVATFDAKDGEAYNMGNCQIAQELFQKQPGVTVKYLCEKDKYKK
jgi:hypothetical protein